MEEICEGMILADAYPSMEKKKPLEVNHVGKTCKLACWFSTQSAMVILKDRKHKSMYMNLAEFDSQFNSLN